LSGLSVNQELTDLGSKRVNFSFTDESDMRHGFVLGCILVSAMLISGCGDLSCYTRRNREAVLRNELFRIRIAIQNYTLNKERGPKLLSDLVQNGFLKEIPPDPFTRKTDWVPVIDATSAPSQIIDVHSASDKIGCNGVLYGEW
jgi:general secretion pathway protein G